jgi:hypothetical protein
MLKFVMVVLVQVRYLVILFIFCSTTVNSRLYRNPLFKLPTLKVLTPLLLNQAIVLRPGFTISSDNGVLFQLIFHYLIIFPMVRLA